MLSKNEKNRLIDLVKQYVVNGVVNRIDLENEIATNLKGLDIYEAEKILEEHRILVSNDEVAQEAEVVQIEIPFNPEQIDIVMDRIVCLTLINRLKNNAIELESDFQRKAGLWSIEQKSRLIESILLNIPLPAFYFDSSDKDKWLVIDGLQRLSTINEFVVQEKFKLTNLEFLEKWDGCKFSELPYSMRSTIEETNFNAYFVRKNTPKNVKYNIFKRINTGGLVLTPQEIRNALYQGKATKFLSKMSKNEKFLLATSNSIKTDRMLDREFCLRYIAFTKLSLDEYNNSIDDFLISGMEFLNNSEDQRLEKYYSEFQKTMDVIYKVFGEYSFRKMRSDGRRTPINKAIYEGWSVIISELSEDEQNKIILNSKMVRDKFTEICEENASFINHIKANDKNSIKSRLNVFSNIIKEVL